MRARRQLTGGLLVPATGCGDPYNQGPQAYERGAWDEAMAPFQKGRKLSGQYTEALATVSKARLKLGRQACERGDWQEALVQLGGMARRGEEYHDAQELVDGSNFHLEIGAYDRGAWPEALDRLRAVRETSVHCKEAEAMIVKAQAEQDAAAVSREKGSSACFLMRSRTAAGRPS